MKAIAPIAPLAAVRCAIRAADAAGSLMRRNALTTKKVNEATQHDLKLELDVRCQQLIERALRKDYPSVAILGEEGVHGDPEAAYRWVIDPIDGTVNFAYGIPHACVSIALQQRVARPRTSHPDARYRTIGGVVHDPFCREMWSAAKGDKARLNGRPIRVSRRPLEEAIVSLGFAKSRESLQRMLPTLEQLVHRVRKVRIMGAAALDLVYVASGRFDAYVEYGLRLWDIAAGGFILERAGGDFRNEPVEGEHTYRIVASNGRVRNAIVRMQNRPAAG